MAKKIIGLTEKITIIGKDKSKTARARIDTGATKSSIDSKLAKELNLGPAIRSIRIRSAHGRSTRPIIRVPVEIAGKRINAEFTTISRSHMKYAVLIGRNILEKGFLIDPRKR